MRRRELLLQLVPALGTGALHAQSTRMPQALTRPVASSGEQIPVVGLGSWITFNVGNDRSLRDQCTEVMRHFFGAGGRLIDSSPMYGSSQGVIGEGLQNLRSQQRANAAGPPQGVRVPSGGSAAHEVASVGAIFSADKVWTSSDGAAQIEQSRQLWRVPRFDLLQVHNLLAWEKQLPLLQAMKAAGTLRHVGITTSEGRRHRELGQIMRTQRIDFVQLSYNLLDREVEETLLPLARERGIAVLVNRPFRQGALLRQLQRHPLPGWAREIDCTTWAQAALKFIVSHPAVTCAIPATSSALHVRENMAAARGPMPDEALRKRMAADVGKL